MNKQCSAATLVWIFGFGLNSDQPANMGLKMVLFLWKKSEFYPFEDWKFPLHIWRTQGMNEGECASPAPHAYVPPYCLCGIFLHCTADALHTRICRTPMHCVCGATKNKKKILIPTALQTHHTSTCAYAVTTLHVSKKFKNMRCTAHIPHMCICQTAPLHACAKNSF